jgi:putative nucleotidyltransferase with HDIG domain
MIFLFSFLLANFAIGNHAFALQTHVKFENITSIDGLSHDTVYSIVQDKTGFLWFGTEDGLNRYDGYKINVYRGGHNENSIGNANCAFLYVDGSNSIWVASWGSGIQVLDQKNGLVKSYMHYPADDSSLSDNNVQNIFEDSRGTLWFGTYTGGLNRFDSKSETFITYTHSENEKNSISDNRVWWIIEDLDGSLLIATNKGLDKFNPETGVFTNFSQIENRVRTVFRDKNNKLWLGTQKGLCLFNTTTGETEYYYHEFDNPASEVITSIFEDSQGNLWVGSSSGANIFDRETGVFTRFTYDLDDTTSLGNDDVRVIFEDRSANIWIGTRGGGVSKLNIKPQKFKFYNDVQNEVITLSDINVSSIFQSSDEVLWVGTNNGGLNRFDLNANKQDHLMTDITKEENRNLLAICEDANSMWVGSLGGLNRIDKQSGIITTYKNDTEKNGTLSHNTVLSLLKDSRDIIWVGTLSGLNQFDKANDQFITYQNDKKNVSSISSNTIKCLYEDWIGNIWIGTQNGLNLMDRNSKQFTRFSYDKDNSGGISDSIIHCIFEDSSQNLWIGTQYGLNRFDRVSKSFDVYTTEDGLPNNCINGIREDEFGKLWLSTNRGISCFDTVGNTFSNYDVWDGLQGNGYNVNASLTTSYGDILFGGTKGLDQINPSLAAKSTFMPQIVITSFRVMDKEINLNGTLNHKGALLLPYNTNDIRLEFSSLDFTKIDRNGYAYMLDGFDKEWIYNGTTNNFNYTNIPSGNYILRIKGTNSDGVWNEDGISVNIRVSTPWWRSNYAYLAYALLIILILITLIRFFALKQMRKQVAISKMLHNTINVMSRIGEMRDLYTAGHQRRVQKLACAIAKQMGLKEERINNIYFGSLIHDIGKINIASEYLNKPGKLTDLEFKILQSHVMLGFQVIEEIGLPEEVVAIVCQHHERLDGLGYPEGINRDKILLESRIVAVADVVEAMSSDRPYRAAVGIDAALAEILKFRGIKFDEKVVDACIILFREKGFKFSS